MTSPCNAAGAACTVLSSREPCNQAEPSESHPSPPYATFSLYTHRIWGGSRQGYPKSSLQPDLQLWTSPGLIPAAQGNGAEGGCTAASHRVTGSTQLLQTFPQNNDLKRQKDAPKPPDEPPEEQSEPLQIAANTISSSSFFCPTGSTAYTPSKTANDMLAGQVCPLSLSTSAQQ